MSNLNNQELLEAVKKIALKERNGQDNYLMDNIKVINGDIYYLGHYSDNSFVGNIKIHPNQDGSRFKVTSKQSPYYYNSNSLWSAINGQCLINSRIYCNSTHSTIAQQKIHRTKIQHHQEVNQLKKAQIDAKLTKSRIDDAIAKGASSEDVDKLEDCLKQLDARLNDVSARQHKKHLKPVVMDSHPIDDNFIQNYDSDINSDANKNSSSVQKAQPQTQPKYESNYYPNKTLSKNALAHKYHIKNVNDVMDLKGNGMQELSNMIGLKSVKQQMKEYINDARVVQRLNQLGQQTRLGSLNLIFMGNPGTGKTVVARKVGKIMFQNHIIRKPLFKECGAKNLIAGYEGQTALKTASVIKSALGGVLFIDEAYQLAPSKNNSGDNDSYKQEAVSELLRLSENHRDDLVVILAGYKDKMENLLNSNHGLRSRFNHKIIFSDYSNQDMYNILSYMAKRNKCLISSGNRYLIQKKLTNFIAFAKKHKDDSNGRLMRNLLQAILGSRNNRIGANVYKMTLSQINTITTDDIKNGFNEAYSNEEN